MRMESLLGDPKLVKDTLEFVEKPGRFNLTVYVDPLSCQVHSQIPPSQTLKEFRYKTLEVLRTVLLC